MNSFINRAVNGIKNGDRTIIQGCCSHYLSGSKNSFDEYEGLFHMQMSEFEIKTTESIRIRDEEKVLASFMLAERCYRRGDEAMKNAIEVSFVEGVLSLLSKEDKKWGWERMPQLLKDLYIGFGANILFNLRMIPF